MISLNQRHTEAPRHRGWVFGSVTSPLLVTSLDALNRGDAETRRGRLWACRAAAPSEHADARRSWKANEATPRRELFRAILVGVATPPDTQLRVFEDALSAQPGSRNQDNLRCAPARGDGPSARRVAAPGQSHLRRLPDGPSLLLRREGLTKSLLPRSSHRLRCHWPSDESAGWRHAALQDSSPVPPRLRKKRVSFGVGYLAERSVGGMPTRVRDESARRLRGSARLRTRESASDPGVQRSWVAVRALSGMPRSFAERDARRRRESRWRVEDRCPTNQLRRCMPRWVSRASSLLAAEASV